MNIKEKDRSCLGNVVVLTYLLHNHLLSQEIIERLALIDSEDKVRLLLSFEEAHLFGLRLVLLFDVLSKGLSSGIRVTTVNNEGLCSKRQRIV
jgi:hypothetical protein